MDVRMRLKQATSSVTNFGKVHQASIPREALEKMRVEGPIDVVFISYQYDKQQLTDFVKEAKQDPAGQDTAYVLILKRKGESNAALAEYMLTGADGFLFEPFSVDELVEITVLATRIKKERLAARELIAVKLLLKDLIKHLDALYLLLRNGMLAETTKKKFEHLCSRLPTLQPETKILYYDLAVEMFGRVPVPNRDHVGRRYEGNSRRVKERLEKLLLERLNDDKERQPPG
jgi:CheY-like chemotaxis protein